MQDAVGKVKGISNAAIKRLGSKKSNKHLSSGGQDLAELVRAATSKTLNRPDEELNQEVVDLIGSAIHTDGPHVVAKIFTDRLDQNNPHKVWLAILLIREVLQKAMKEIGPAREDIMAVVEKIASAPLDRFDKNLKDQQSTKHAAFELLKMYGHAGHILSQPQQEKEAGDRKEIMQARQEKEARAVKTKPDIMDQVREEIGKLDNQNALLQDLLLDKTPFQSKSPEDQALAKDILLDAQKMGQTFERLLGQLSSDERPEAQTLMQQALEKVDVLNNSLDLHKAAIKTQAERITGKPFDQIKSPTKASREGRTPKKSGGDDFSLIDFQEPGPAPSTQAGQSYDPFAASTPAWPGSQQGLPQAGQNQVRPSYNPQQGPPSHLQSQSSGQNPFYSQAGPQAPINSPQSMYQQGPASNSQNPYQPGAFPQGPSSQPPGYHGNYPQQPPQFPYGYGYGGYGQQVPNYGQPYGQPPPNYGQPYSHPSNPYSGQGAPWGGQPSFGQQPPQDGFSGLQTAGSYPGAPQPSTSQPSQGPQTARQSEAPKNEIPIYTADIVINEPTQRQAQPTRGPEAVAASLPISDTAKPEDVGFGEPAFPGKSAQASPVPPKTPVNTQSAGRSANTPDSAERLTQQPVSTPAADNFGFEPSAFGGSNFSTQPVQSQAQSGLGSSTSQPSHAPSTSHAPQTTPATQPSTDWDLFFTERSSKPEPGLSATPAGNVSTSFGDLSLNHR